MFCVDSITEIQMLIAHEKLETSGVHDSVIGANPFSAISESRARKTGGGSLQSTPQGSMDYIPPKGTWMPLQGTLRDGCISSQGIP
jgi:hypothetical protein